MNGRIPPSPAVLAVQGKGQFPYPRQKNRFGVFPVLLQGLDNVGGIFLQPIHFDESELGQRILVAGSGLLFQGGQVASQLGFRKIRDGVQGRNGIHVSLFRKLAAGSQPFRMFRLHGLRLENPENPVRIRHHELGCRMAGCRGRITEKMLHMFQAGQRQVSTVQVIKPHPVFPGQHIGPEVSSRGFVQHFPVRPAAVHRQLGEVPDRSVFHLPGRICRCGGRNVLAISRNGKNKGNKQKTGSHGSTLF